jgi:hypothetical protein
VEDKAKALIVWLILNGETEKALEQLAKQHSVSVPNLEVGLPKKHKKRAAGCYTARNKTISVLNSDTLKNPFIILHEFYHHLRTTVDQKQKGTEKYANEFARDFIEAYRRVVAEALGNN